LDKKQEIGQEVAYLTRIRLENGNYVFFSADRVLGMVGQQIFETENGKVSQADPKQNLKQKTWQALGWKQQATNKKQTKQSFEHLANFFLVHSLLLCLYCSAPIPSCFPKSIQARSIITHSSAEHHFYQPDL